MTFSFRDPMSRDRINEFGWSRVELILDVLEIEYRDRYGSRLSGLLIYDARDCLMTVIRLRASSLLNAFGVSPPPERTRRFRDAARGDIEAREATAINVRATVRDKKNRP